MKRLICILISVFLVFALFAQQRTEPYDFPVKPGTEEWAKLSTSRQMDEVCVIPENILKSLSTEALLITCMNYPRIIDFFLASNLQSGFDFYSKHFNGLAELIKRPDLSVVCLKSYSNLDLTEYRISGYDQKLNIFQIGFLELLLSQNVLLEQLGKEEKTFLLKEAINKLEKRKELKESLNRNVSTALIISRILRSEDLYPYEFDSYDSSIYDAFNSYAIVIDTAIFENLLHLAKEINF